MNKFPNIIESKGKNTSSKLTNSAENPESSEIRLPNTIKSVGKSDKPDQINSKKVTHRPLTVSTSLGSYRTRCFLPQEEQFKQIRRCRYIRKSLKQQSPEDIELDISFLRDEKRDRMKEVTNNVEIEKVCLSRHSSDSSIRSNFSKMNDNEMLNENNNKVSAIQPFSPFGDDLALTRDKMEPLLVQFTDKCSLGQTSLNYTSTTVTDLKKRRETKVDRLYKEISMAAQNAQVDLATVSRNVKDSRGSLKKQRLFDKGRKKWTFLRGLVRSGWLLGKKGRSLKLMESQRRKRMLADSVDIPLLISRTKKSQIQLRGSYIRRKIAKNKKLPPLNFSDLATQ